MLGKMYHNDFVPHIVFGDDLEWFPRTHHLGSLRQLLYRCTHCTCCTGTLGTAGTATVQQTRLGQQQLCAVPAVPLYLLYRCTAVPAVPPGLRDGLVVPHTCAMCAFAASATTAVHTGRAVRTVGKESGVGRSPFELPTREAPPLVG